VLYARTLVDISGMIMLYASSEQRREMLLRYELDAMSNILQRQYEQYQQFEANNEAMHRVYHDLKHQITYLESETNREKRMESLKEMKEIIRTHESKMNTGNNVLDVLLTSKSLICAEPQIDWKKALCNINILAMALGFFFFCTRIIFPGILGQGIKSLGDALGATSMLSIGISFATISHLDLKKISRVASVAVLRLILSPLAMMLIFLTLRLHTLLPGAQQILLITLLGAGAPTGVVITQMAQLYDKEADHASLIGVFTMLCALVSMPALIWVYETIAPLF